MLFRGRALKKLVLYFLTFSIAIFLVLAWIELRAPAAAKRFDYLIEDYKKEVGDNEELYPLQLGATISIDVRLWVDLPGDFRKCVSDYNGNGATVECSVEEKPTQAWRIPIMDKSFHIYNHDNMRCLEPLEEAHWHEHDKIYVFVKNCSSGLWTYSSSGQLRWNRGQYCLHGLGSGLGNHISIETCSRLEARQRFEFGMVKYNDITDDNELTPLSIDSWQRRQNAIRDWELQFVMEDVRKAMNFTDYDSVVTVKRRAAVFYIDKSSSFISYLKWWILAWKLLGLNSVESSFDLVVFAHPDMIGELPAECSQIRLESIDDTLKGAGKCLYSPLLGISLRNKNYDNYLNSHECLVNENSRFLAKYSHLLRSDMDTFPTPGLVNSWPDFIYANKFMYYTFFKSNNMTTITDALRAATAHLGVEHHGWHDIGSTWYGPSHRILKLSKLTVALSQYLRVYLFGPGTFCRCATCKTLHPNCSWGKGLYAPTTLLYSQEIAMNILWTAEEYEKMSEGHLDIDTVNIQQNSICNPQLLHLHIFHHENLFSKFAFMRGNYTEYNMTSLQLDTITGYSTYIALTANSQGLGGQELTEKYNLKSDGSLLSICNMSLPAS